MTDENQEIVTDDPKRTLMLAAVMLLQLETTHAVPEAHIDAACARAVEILAMGYAEDEKAVAYMIAAMGRLHTAWAKARGIGPGAPTRH